MARVGACSNAAFQSQQKQNGLEQGITEAYSQGGESEQRTIFLLAINCVQNRGVQKDLLWNQKFFRDFYQRRSIQTIVAILIFVNFSVSAVNAQVLPDKGTIIYGTFVIIEWVLALVFAAELFWNMYGSFFLPFWTSGWNIFDFVIVVISMCSLIWADVPAMNVLRLFRAFRVFRLFKRVDSLRAIIEGVFASMPGVFNAFMVLGLLMGIWSIMGVEFFGEFADEEFGTFFRAMFTMFQVMTMDSWASTIARGMINGPQSTWVATWVAPPFFVLFIFIAGIVMTNVVVAILLEKYLSATHSRNRAKQKQKDRAKQKQKAKANRRKRSKARRLPMNGDSKSTGGEVFPEQPLSPGGKRRWRQALSLAKATAKAKISARHEVQQVQKAHSQHIRKIKKSIEHTLGHVKHTSYRGSRSPSNRLVQDNDSFEAWNQSDSASALSKTNADNEMQFHHLSEVTEAELAGECQRLSQSRSECTIFFTSAMSFRAVYISWTIVCMIRYCASSFFCHSLLFAKRNPRAADGDIAAHCIAQI